MPYAGQPERVHGGGGGPSTANRSKIYCRRCSSVIDEEEEEEEGKDGDATGPLSSGDAVAGGGDAGGEGADGTRSVEEEEELGVHQPAGEGAAETVNNNDAASSSASGRGGVTAVPVQRGDGLGGAPENRWAGFRIFVEPSRFVFILPVSLGLLDFRSLSLLLYSCVSLFSLFPLRIMRISLGYRMGFERALSFIRPRPIVKRCFLDVVVAAMCHVSPVFPQYPHKKNQDAPRKKRSNQRAFFVQHTPAAPPQQRVEDFPLSAILKRGGTHSLSFQNTPTA